MSFFQRELDHLSSQKLYNELTRSCGRKSDFNLDLSYGLKGKFVVRFEEINPESRAIQKAYRIENKMKFSDQNQPQLRGITSFRNFSRLPLEIQTMIM